MEFVTVDRTKPHRLSLIQKGQGTENLVEVEVFNEDHVSYEPVEALSESEEIVVEEIEDEDNEYKQSDGSDFRSCCCNAYFNDFASLFHHMLENHINNVKKSLGINKELVMRYIQEYETDGIEEEYETELIQEEYWVEEEVEYKPDVCVEEDGSGVEYMTSDNEQSIQVFPKKIRNLDRNIKTEDFIQEETISDSAPQLFQSSQCSEPSTFEEDEQEYKCSKCEQICKGLSQLRRHERRHLPPLVCSKCDQHFSNKHSLRKHLFWHKAEQRGTTDLMCSFCEYIFESKEQLESHRVEIHARSEVPFQCSECPRTFSVKFNLIKHFEDTHGPNKKIKCKLCYKKISDEQTLKQHMQEHDNEELSVCGHCGKSFKGKKTLRHHISYYHTKSGYVEAGKNRNLHCSICSKAFTYPNQVRNHEINVHGVGEMAFFCKICQKGFAKQWDLENHQLMHSNNKPFPCDQCGKAFRRATHLKSHQYNVHTPSTDKPDITCLLCHKAFKSMESLRKHLRKAHQITMMDMYKQAGIPYNGREILTSKLKVNKNIFQAETIEIEVL